MRVGIIGSGQVGQTIGSGLAERGHSVMLGSRDPGKPEVTEWAERTRARAGTFAEVAGYGEMIVLATLWSGTENAIRMAGPERLAGKVVIDVTNPLDFPPNAPPRLAVGFTDSGGEQVQRWLPGARVVKAFNTVGAALMVDPQLPGGPPDMFICGNDDAAKSVVGAICRDFGWDVDDVGGIEGARLLEPLAMLWITLGSRSSNWNQALKLLRG